MNKLKCFFTSFVFILIFSGCNDPETIELSFLVKEECKISQFTISNRLSFRYLIDPTTDSIVREPHITFAYTNGIDRNEGYYFIKTLNNRETDNTDDDLVITISYEPDMRISNVRCVDKMIREKDEYRYRYNEDGIFQIDFTRSSLEDENVLESSSLLVETDELDNITQISKRDDIIGFEPLFEYRYDTNTKNPFYKTAIQMTMYSGEDLPLLASLSPNVLTSVTKYTNGIPLAYYEATYDSTNSISYPVLGRVLTLNGEAINTDNELEFDYLCEVTFSGVAP